MEGHPTYHVNMIKLKWEIIWTGRLPYLPGVPNLHVMHLSIDKPQPQAYVGQSGGFLWYLKAWLGISQDLLSIFTEVGERGGDLTRT